MRARRALAIACVAACASLQARAQPVITDPDWVRRPTPEEMQALIPLEAVKKRIAGRVVLTCLVSTLGSLRDCKVQKEEPEGYGFGMAALRLVPSFLMKPRLEDGRPVVGDVQIPIKFNLNEVPSDAFVLGSPVISISNPPWTDAPTLAQFEAAYPRALLGKGVIGHASVRCGFAPDGSLQRCAVLNENPSGKRFGAAAKSLLPRFRVDVAALGARPLADMRIDLPFHFIDPQSPQWAQRTIPRPIWTRRFNPEALQSIYPAKAKAAGLKTGRAVVRCLVGEAGGLGDCTVEEETPPGLGFGDAAVTMAKAMALVRWTQDGFPAEGVAVTMPIRMTLEDEAAPTPPTRP